MKIMAGNASSSRNASQVLDLANPNMRQLTPYAGGVQLDSYGGVTKLNQNEAPYPPPPPVTAVGDRFNAPNFMNRYPPGDHKTLKEKFATYLGIRPEQMTFGNGSDEVLSRITRVFLNEGDSIGYVTPEYSMWPVLEETAGAQHIIINMPDDYALPVGKVSAAKPKLFLFSNPHTPSGVLTPADDVRRLCEELYPNVVVEDEAYADFAEDNSLRLLEDYPNLIITRTLSKAFALAGMRLGYGMGNPQVIAPIDAIRDPYNINAATYAAGLAALEPESLKYYRGMIELIKSERTRLRNGLEGVGFSVVPSQSNFLLAKTESPVLARTLYDGLSKDKIFVRYFSDSRLADCLRISVGMPEENDRVVAGIRRLLGK